MQNKLNYKKAELILDNLAETEIGCNISDFYAPFAEQLIKFYANGILTKAQIKKFMLGPDDGEELKVKGKDGKIYILGDTYGCYETIRIA